MKPENYHSRRTVNSMGVHEYQVWVDTTSHPTLSESSEAPSEEDSEVSFNGQMGIGATLHDAQVDAGLI